MLEYRGSHFSYRFKKASYSYSHFDYHLLLLLVLFLYFFGAASLAAKILYQDGLDGGEDGKDDEDLEDGDLKSQQDVAPEYKQLIAIHAGKMKGGLDEWLAVDPDKVRRLSLSEQELEKAVITHGRKIVRYYGLFDLVH